MLKHLIDGDLGHSDAKVSSEWKVAFETFLRLFKISSVLSEFRLRQAAVSALSLLFIPLSLLNPYLSQLAVDQSLLQRSVGEFFRIGFWIGAVSFSVMVLQNYFTYLQNRLTLEAREHITKRIYAQMTGMSLAFFRGRGNHVTRNILGADGVEVAVQSLVLVPEIVVAAVGCAVKLLVVFVIDWRLGLIALLSPPLYAFQATVLARRNREVAKVEREAQLAYSKELSDCITNIDLVKAFRSESYHEKKFSKVLSGLSKLWHSNEKFALYFGWASGLLKKVIDGLPIVFAGYLVARGRLTLGQMTAAVLYTSQFLAANTKLIDCVPRLSSLSVSTEVFLTFLKMRPDVAESADAKPARFSEGRVEAHNVSFSYVPGIPVLRDVSLSFPARRWTGIKAPSGYGKTTLLNLILRAYDPDEGRILIDGHDIRRVKFDSLREQIGVVLQQSFLTRDTVRRCIAYDQEDAKMEDIVEAARIAGIHDQILALEEGYDTVCGEGGLNLSQGQRQRVAIARALLRKPKILVMDEAFGSVDRETEDRIIGEMRRSFPDMTVLVVSHNESVLAKMDAVVDLAALAPKPAAETVEAA